MRGRLLAAVDRKRDARASCGPNARTHGRARAQHCHTLDPQKQTGWSEDESSDDASGDGEYHLCLMKTCL